MSNVCNPNNVSGLKQADFQKDINGKKTDLYILTNKLGNEVAFTNYGGALLTIMMPDRNGKLGNVVQGHDSIDKVVASPEPFLSTLIGRYGNRIKHGKFTLDGQEYKLAVNNGPNHLHGGPTGYHARVWDAEVLAPNSVKLHYISPDGEEGFPGTLDITVVYTLTDDNELVIDYKATTDKKTIVNLTHHAFFSPSGIEKDTASVENNILTLNADHYCPVDETSIPYGRIDHVEGTPMDFRSPKPIGRDINEDYEPLILQAGYDHNFEVFTDPCAILTDPVSGRTMAVSTDCPGVQFYCGNFLSGEIGKDGVAYIRRGGVALETQYYPDSVNHPEWPQPIFKAGQRYHSETKYIFK